MTHLGAGASPAIVGVIVSSACIVAVGFMVRFLVVLTVENRKLHAVHVLHPGGVHSEADTNCVAAPFRKPTVHSAAFVAIGVVRITTALASNAGRRKNDTSVARSPAVTLKRPSPEIGFSGEHRYRSG
jgi:hypothetical protein